MPVQGRRAPGGCREEPWPCFCHGAGGQRRCACQAGGRVSVEWVGMEIGLGGRVGVVTGGSQGIGLAIATRMAASGADVALLARRPEVLASAGQLVAKTARGRVQTVSCDVSKADDVARAYGEVMASLGRVDIVVNNAGASQTGAFTGSPAECWAGAPRSQRLLAA